MCDLIKSHLSKFRVHFFVVLTVSRRGADRAGTKIRYPTRVPELLSVLLSSGYANKKPLLQRELLAIVESNRQFVVGILTAAQHGSGA